MTTNPDTSAEVCADCHSTKAAKRMPVHSKPPTRRELLVYITKIQDRVSAASAAAVNENLDPRHTRAPLQEALDLCFDALGNDEPIRLASE